MSISHFKNFKINAELEEFAKFLRKHCGINFKRKNEEYQACICGVFVYLDKSDDGIVLFTISYAGLHFNFSGWPTVHDFLCFSVTEWVCANFKCNAKIFSDCDFDYVEATYNPPPKDCESQKQKSDLRDYRVVTFEKKTMPRVDQSRSLRTCI